VPITDTMGLFEVGGRYEHRAINPLHKYSETYRVRV
jgi:hypothetical protein